MSTESDTTSAADTAASADPAVPAVTDALPQAVLDGLMKAKPRTVLKPVRYTDGDGRQITEMELVSGPPMGDGVRFIAHGEIHLKVKQPMPGGAPAEDRIQAIPVNVVIKEAQSLDHAFDLYDACVASAGRAHVEQLKSQHVRAQLANTGGLVVPNRR